MGNPPLCVTVSIQSVADRANLSTSDVLARLLALNLERAAARAVNRRPWRAINRENEGGSPCYTY